MTTIKTIATALIGAGAALLAIRLPLPDGTALGAASRSLGHDALTGVHALRWEGHRLLESSGVHTAIESALAWIAGGAPALALALLSGAAVIAFGLQFAIRRWLAARRDGPTRSGRPTDPRVTRARALAREGVVALDVARQTDLSRDAVALVTRLHCPE
jgi:hypothetical protein